MDHINAKSRNEKVAKYGQSYLKRMRFKHNYSFFVAKKVWWLVGAFLNLN